MNKFTIGSVLFKITEKELKQSLNDIYYAYHKKNPFRKHFLDEDKYPIYKKTADIFSVTLWIKDSAGVEKKINLDGIVFLNSLSVHTITIEGEHFSSEAIEEFVFVFNSLFNHAQSGYIYYEIDGFSYRVNKEGVTNYSELIEELYDAIPLEKQLSFKLLKENLQSSFSE